MKNINLIPDIKQERLKSRKRRRLIFGSAVVAIFIGLGVPALLGVLLLGQNGLIASEQNKIDEAIEEINANEDLPIALTVQNNLEKLPNLSDGGFSLQLFLEEIMPRVVTERVAIEGIELSVDDEFVILNGEARSVSDVYQVAELMRAIEITNAPSGQDQFDSEEDNHIFKEVKVVFIDPDFGQVSYSIEAVMDSSKFDRDLYVKEVEAVEDEGSEEEESS